MNRVREGRSILERLPVRWWVVLVIALGPLCLFGPSMVEGRVLFWGTPILQFVPWRQFALSTVLAGHLPLWNPLVGLGAPLLGQLSIGVALPSQLDPSLGGSRLGTGAVGDGSSCVGWPRHGLPQPADQLRVAGSVGVWPGIQSVRLSCGPERIPVDQRQRRLAPLGDSGGRSSGAPGWGRTVSTSRALVICSGCRRLHWSVAGWTCPGCLVYAAPCPCLGGVAGALEDSGEALGQARSEGWRLYWR